ncbi:MAG: hypothetical protein HOQ24_17220 [Mycobacteriaceae bacterium]|nr:hypothetical protein [Mycobacteriaceae bacterium]
MTRDVRPAHVTGHSGRKFAIRRPKPACGSRLRDAAAPGSYLGFTHACGDTDAEFMARSTSDLRAGTAQAAFRTAPQIATYLAGFEPLGRALDRSGSGCATNCPPPGCRRPQESTETVTCTFPRGR